MLRLKAEITLNCEGGDVWLGPFSCYLLSVLND